MGSLEAQTIAEQVNQNSSPKPRTVACLNINYFIRDLGRWHFCWSEHNFPKAASKSIVMVGSFWRRCGANKRELGLLKWCGLVPRINLDLTTRFFSALIPPPDYFIMALVDFHGGLTILYLEMHKFVHMLGRFTWMTDATPSGLQRTRRCAHQDLFMPLIRQST
jgi:hypothetical protein